MWHCCWPPLTLFNWEQVVQYRICTVTLGGGDGPEIRNKELCVATPSCTPSVTRVWVSLVVFLVPSLSVCSIHPRNPTSCTLYPPLLLRLSSRSRIWDTIANIYAANSINTACVLIMLWMKRAFGENSVEMLGVAGKLAPAVHLNISRNHLHFCAF